MARYRDPVLQRRRQHCHAIWLPAIHLQYPALKSTSPRVFLAISLVGMTGHFCVWLSRLIAQTDGQPSSVTKRNYLHRRDSADSEGALKLSRSPPIRQGQLVNMSCQTQLLDTLLVGYSKHQWMHSHSKF